jgi:2'-5' RNA ligase
MRYMIAYMIRGEPAWRISRLSDELADVFTLEPLNERIGPHLTLKAPFETGSERNVEELKSKLADFCAARTAAHSVPPAITYSGFGHFDKRVIFVNVTASPEATKLSADLLVLLRTLPWVKFSRTDGEKHLHATICYAEKRSIFEEVKKYLANETIKSESAITNISLLFQDSSDRRSWESPWKLLAEYSL